MGRSEDDTAQGEALASCTTGVACLPGEKSGHRANASGTEETQLTTTAPASRVGDSRTRGRPGMGEPTVGARGLDALRLASLLPPWPQRWGQGHLEEGAPRRAWGSWMAERGGGQKGFARRRLSSCGRITLSELGSEELHSHWGSHPFASMGSLDPDKSGSERGRWPWASGDRAGATEASGAGFPSGRGSLPAAGLLRTEGELGLGIE